MTGIARERSSPLAQSLVSSDPGVGRGSASAGSSVGQPMVLGSGPRFETASRRWLEQMLLYLRALQLLSAGIQYVQYMMKNGELSNEKEVRTGSFAIHSLCLPSNVKFY